jgi:uncharacterized protein
MVYRFWTEETTLQLNEVEFGNARPIEGYGPGFFRIAGTAHKAPLVVTGSGVFSWNGYDEIAGLLELADRIDVLFIGTGDEITHIPKQFRSALEAVGLGVEVMSSPSACRTYNVLLSEERRVAVALFPIKGA